MPPPREGSGAASGSRIAEPDGGARDWRALLRAIASRAYGRIAALGVVLGVVATALGLFSDARGLLRGDAPKAEIDARISKVEQTRSAEPLSEYLTSVRLPKRSYSAAQLAQPGYEFAVSVTITGRRGAELPLRWRLFRRPETPLPGPLYDQEAVGFSPRADRDSNTWPVWVPHPPEPGTYFVRFVLLDEERRPASTATSRPFRHPPG